MKLAVINGWLAQDTEQCNCGGGYPMGTGHMPGCSYEPLVELDVLLPALRDAGYAVEKRDDLVKHIGAAVRAEMLVAPETMFRDAGQIGETVLRMMAEDRS